MRFHEKKYICRLAIAVCLPFMFANCAGKKDETSQISMGSDEVIPVTAATVSTVQSDLPVYASGILSSSGEQRLAFKVGGVIQKIYVKEGDQVRPGQLLAILDKTEIDAQVAQATEAFKKAERDLGRVEGLYRDSSATLELLENATTGWKVAKANRDIAAFNAQFAEIRAIKAGKIIKKIANEGEVTGPGMPVLALFETGPQHWVVRVSVSDRDWARLSLGAPASIHLDAYPEMSFKGRVTLLAPAADPSSGLYTVELSIEAGNKRLAPGLFATVELTPDKNTTFLSVPIEAIVEGAGRQAFVFVVQADQRSVKKTPVQVAYLSGKSAMVTAGLMPGQFVVTAGAPYLNEQKKVQVISK